MNTRARDLKITQSITKRDTRSLENYFRDIGKSDLLTTEDEINLAVKIRQGDKAALERLVKSNLRFVVSVAKKYQHFGVPLEDLINEGNIGLMKAAERFDETRGFKFISFAVWWIRQSILAALSDQKRLIRLPMNHQNFVSKIMDASEELEHRLERQPTDLELAEYLDLEISKVDDALYYSGRIASLDAPVSMEDEHTLIDKLWNGEQTIEHVLLDDSQKKEVNAMLEILSYRERRVIEMTFGFDGFIPPSEIADILGLSYERVRQLKMTALQKLREIAVPA